MPRKICPRSRLRRSLVPGRCRWSNRVPRAAREQIPERRPGRWPLLIAAAGRRRVHWGRSVVLLVLLCIAVAYAYSALLPAAVAVVAPHRGPAVQAVYATGTVEPSVMIPIAPRGMARLVELKSTKAASSKRISCWRASKTKISAARSCCRGRGAVCQVAARPQAQLIERGVAARSAYDRARADWEKATALRERAEAEAHYLDLVAPASGKIIRRDGEIGQVIAPDKPILWMSCCDPLRVSAEVDEEDIAQVRSRPGGADPRRCVSGADLPRNGAIDHAEGRSRCAHLPGARLAARRYAADDRHDGRDQHRAAQGRSALLVPAGAVRQDTVWLVENGKLSPGRVTSAPRGRTKSKFSGLADGDRIVANPAAGMKAGQAVRPSEDSRCRRTRSFVCAFFSDVFFDSRTNRRELARHRSQEG